MGDYILPLYGKVIKELNWINGVCTGRWFSHIPLTLTFPGHGSSVLLTQPWVSSGALLLVRPRWMGTGQWLGTMALTASLLLKQDDSEACTSLSPRFPQLDRALVAHSVNLFIIIFDYTLPFHTSLPYSLSSCFLWIISQIASFLILVLKSTLEEDN